MVHLPIKRKRTYSMSIQGFISVSFHLQYLAQVFTYANNINIEKKSISIQCFNLASIKKIQDKTVNQIFTDLFALRLG